MNKVTIDRITLERLNRLGERLEICDESGRTLGYFTPANDHSLYEGVEPPVTEEELQRREQEAETYSTAEVVERLKKL